MSLRVARRLRERGIGARVVDLRWLAPLPLEEVLRGRDGDRPRRSSSTRRAARAASGRGSSRSSSTRATRDGSRASSSKDSFVPLGDAARLVLLSEDEIEAAALALARLSLDPVGRFTLDRFAL